MQFVGYLRRNPNDLPDTNYDGYNFWLAKLNQFNGNFIQAEMVKAFIVSSEYRSRFQPTSVPTPTPTPTPTPSPDTYSDASARPRRRGDTNRLRRYRRLS